MFLSGNNNETQSRSKALFLDSVMVHSVSIVMTPAFRDNLLVDSESPIQCSSSSGVPALPLPPSPRIECFPSAGP